MKIVELNGFIHIKDSDITFDWAPDDAFPLNTTTREYFKRDILPLIKTNKCLIDYNLYTKIKKFVQNPISENCDKGWIQPPGIELKPHQIDAVKLMFKYNKYGFFLGTGTGKTLIAITWLLNIRPNKALIVTPQKVIPQYKEELNKYIPNNKYDVINFEQLKKYTNKNYNAVIIDESHRAKNYMSNINKELRTITALTKYVYLFTGTPQDKQRHEILSQLAILDERVMPVKTRILNRYFFLDDYYNPSREKQEFSKELTTLINSYTWGKTTEEAIELPKEHNYIINCEKPKLYDKLAKNRIIEGFNMACVADTPAKLRIYLREMCAGYIPWTLDDGTRYNQIDNKKIHQLQSVIHDKVSKGIIYYEFTDTIEAIKMAVSMEHHTYTIVNGNTSVKQTEESINKFKSGEVDFLIIQSKSGNAGLDLTNVNDIIFYSLPESYITFHQCQSRIRRIGQTKDVNYYYLLCIDSIEEYIYKSLKKKQSFTDKIFKQYIK